MSNGDAPAPAVAVGEAADLLDVQVGRVKSEVEVKVAEQASMATHAVSGSPTNINQTADGTQVLAAGTAARMHARQVDLPDLEPAEVGAIAAAVRDGRLDPADRDGLTPFLDGALASIPQVAALEIVDRRTGRALGRAQCVVAHAVGTEREDRGGEQQPFRHRAEGAVAVELEAIYTRADYAKARAAWLAATQWEIKE